MGCGNRAGLHPHKRGSRNARLRRADVLTLALELEVVGDELDAAAELSLVLAAQEVEREPVGRKGKRSGTPVNHSIPSHLCDARLQVAHLQVPSVTVRERAKLAYDVYRRFCGNEGEDDVRETSQVS